MNTVWEFNQADHLPPTNQGVCLTLVAYWMQQMRDGKAEVNESGDSQMQVKCVKEAQRLQKFYEKVDLETTERDEAVTWSLRGMKLDSDGYVTCGDTREIVNHLGDKRMGYSMGIYFSDGGGHALGFWRSGRDSGFGKSFSGHTYFFDPNVGCFKGNTGGVANWLQRFLGNNYPTMNQMEIAKVVAADQARPHWGGAFKMV